MKRNRSKIMWGIETTIGFDRPGSTLSVYIAGRYTFPSTSHQVYPWLIFDTRDEARAALSGRGTRKRKNGWLVRYKPIRVVVEIR